jgi:hypothetical protein
MKNSLLLLTILTSLMILGCEDICQPSAFRIHSGDTEYHCNSGTVISRDENFVFCQCHHGTKPVTDAGEFEAITDAGGPEVGN